MSNLQKGFGESILQQSFSIPTTIISYILRQDNSTLLQKDLDFIYKFYSICKCFFAKLKVIPSTQINIEHDHLEIWCIFKYRAKAITTISFEFLNKLEAYFCSDIIHTDFLLLSNPDIIERTPPKGTSMWMPKYYNYRIDYLFLRNQELTLNEFIFLTLNDKCEVIFFDCNIAENDGSIVPVEKLLEVSPKLLQLSLYSFTNNELNYSTPLTSQKLAAFPPFKYLKDLIIYNVSENFEACYFIEFIKKNYKNWSYARYGVKFKDNVCPIFIQNFKDTVDAAVLSLKDVKKNLNKILQISWGDRK